MLRDIVFAREDSKSIKLLESNALRLLAHSSMLPETPTESATVTLVTSSIPTKRTAKSLSATILMPPVTLMETVFAILDSKDTTELARIA
jgi:hypothetical protein